MSQEKIDNLFASESWSAVYTAFSNISLKAYDFDTIREALLAYISQTYPDKFNDFIASSEFVAILDLVAYLGHSISFRNDMNTRENFLATAERRESVLKIAKTLGYNKTRPINARGFMKIMSVTTNQPISDNFGSSLANKTIYWNDTNDVNWYENFISIVDASLHSSSKIQDPISSLTLGSVENYLYEINESPSVRAVNYPITTTIAGKSRRIEVVRTKFKDEMIHEADPDNMKRMTIINRNDNLGPASDRTGFFVFTKLGTLKFKNVRYTNKITNRIENVADTNISNSDVWIQKVDTAGNFVSDVTKVDNDTRETAIYNSLRTGSGDLVSVTTTEDNGIELHYPDGIFGNAAYGDYRIWYRQVDNETFSVNRNDVTDVDITIPYVGEDGRTYNLNMTLRSTRDYAENYAGENYTSVKRIAPRSYYAQDRMVNGQDYNVLPLSIGQNVVKKIKAVNTTFAGNSRYFEMDDVTGHHSNLSITGSDGSVYVDNDDVKMNLRFNRQNGKIDDFIRNSMSRVINHPSLVNLYYYANRENPNSHINHHVLDTGEGIIPITIDNTKRTTSLISTTTSSAAFPFTSGDFIKVELENGNDVWTKIHSEEVPGMEFVLEDILPDDKGDIVETVKGFRTRFTDIEIGNIKRNKIEAENVKSFTIVYRHSEELPHTWHWELYDEDIDLALVPGDDVFVTFVYKGGIRENEAEYIATFTGKRIVFDSASQVKFFYGNKEVVVDNETNLIERDKIIINYSDRTDSVPDVNSTTVDETVGVGYAPIENYTETDDGRYTFTANFANHGSEHTYEFLSDPVTGNQFKNLAFKHELVSPVGIAYTVSPVNDLFPIGQEPEWEIEFDLDDISDFVGDTSEIAREDSTDTTEINVITFDAAQFIDIIDTACVDSACNTTDYYTSTSIGEEKFVNTLGFKGYPNIAYFDDAVDSNDPAFFWIDKSELPTGESETTAAYGMSGVHKSLTVREPSTSNFIFTFPTENLSNWIEDDDTSGVHDIYFKQNAYGEIDFNTSTVIGSLDDLIVKNGNTIIDNRHLELVDNSPDYKIVFWTTDPGVGTEIVVQIKGDGIADLTQFNVRVTASFDYELKGDIKVATYRDIETYVYDDFRTPTGSKVDYNKVKLLSMSNDKNPYGVLDVFSEVDNDTLAVKESYIIVAQEDNNDFEYVSPVAVASDFEPSNVNIKHWFKTNAETDSVAWHYRLPETLEWATMSVDTTTPDDYRNVIINDVNYKVIPGRTYVEDKFFSFRWDHYADADKRIDPSTSNIVDVYVLTTDYVRNVQRWADNGFTGFTPVPANSYELKSVMSSITEKSMLSDHVSYIPVKFKYLFGEYADAESQAVFKVVKKPGTSYTDSEIKSVVSSTVNEYFAIDNWDFGETFYFSELAAYLHSRLPEYISSVLITPKYSGNKFEKLLSITSEPNEIFFSVTTSKDVKIINSITENELLGD